MDSLTLRVWGYADSPVSPREGEARGWGAGEAVDGGQSRAAAHLQERWTGGMHTALQVLGAGLTISTEMESVYQAGTMGVLHREGT